MGKDDWGDIFGSFNSLYGIPSEPEPSKGRNALADRIRGITPKPIPESNSFSDAFSNALWPLSPAPKPPVENNNPSRIGRISDLVSPLGRIPIPVIPNPGTPSPPPAFPSKPASTPGEIEWCRSIVRALLKYKTAVKPGIVLPTVDDLAVMEGRRIRAAFVYSDLHGFTKLVGTQPENKSFVFLHTFIEISNRLTKLYKGEVMDVAGDRVLSVFHRPSSDLSKEPVEDAVTFALWLQTVFNKVIGPAFAGDGLGQLSLGIGVDYGEVVVGCVGIRGNKRIVFFGDPANNAAKLQDIAGPGETVLSSVANLIRPGYLAGDTWNPRLETLSDGRAILRISQIFAAEKPPKPR